MHNRLRKGIRFGGGMANSTSGVVRLEGNDAVAAMGILSIVVLVGLALGFEIEADLAAARISIRRECAGSLLP